MATLRIEFDRGNGWELRSEGGIADHIRIDQIAASLPAYATEYPHRALLDGVVVAVCDALDRGDEA